MIRAITARPAGSRAGEENVGEELAFGVLKRRPRKALGVQQKTYVQLLRLEEGYSVEICPFFPDSEHSDGEERTDDPAAARREALALFRRIARREGRK